ncbi:methionine synthase [Micrococcales bacterium 31B]|nr:methionine synthase [Micrococcales bacterium 31B]
MTTAWAGSGAWAGYGAWAGFGAWAGSDVVEAAATQLGLADQGGGLPALPLLPGRGVGATLAERALVVAGFDDALRSELMPYGWRLTHGGAGADAVRARDLLLRDLDDLAIAALGFEGDLVVPLPGPLATWGRVYGPKGELIVGDAGAASELCDALAHGYGVLCAELARRVPGARPRLVLDETGACAVLDGRLQTASGYKFHAPASEQRALDAWQRFTRGLPGSGAGSDTGAVVWCGERDAVERRLSLLRQGLRDAEWAGLGLDLGAPLSAAAFEGVAEFLDAGGTLWAGLTPPAGLGGAPLDTLAVTRCGSVLTDAAHRVGLDRAALARVVVTPRGPAAAATPAAAREALTLTRDVGEFVREWSAG